ncbi:MAG: peptidase U32 family protein [Candidatus Marinimicrobia bacterium]|nr:peptidase U32 family protein [Candidatus Neomarinimicrobiota bacterium]
MMTTPELLAPAGNLNTAVTAFEHGADAVYAGLSKFNARERTENFTFEDYGRLMAYAQKHGKKVYLTFNTLIKENEVREALTMLHRICRLLPHAVIVQDLGVLSMMRHFFPHIPVHASTQMGIHNSAGMASAERLGIERVILERQVSMEELRQIREHSGIELEVFIHGALCCSLSGLCLFSSWMGGHSGNRGKCKQPCRRRYYAPEGNGFFFSANDLYTLNDIPFLKEMGIHSLKIEGRLRKSDYAAAVVDAYRLMLDAETDEVKQRLPEAREILSRALGRRWSSGFFYKDEYDRVIESEQLGGSGKACGRVLEVKNTGFAMQSFQPLRLNDRIRIQPKSGDEGPSVVVTKITKSGKPTDHIRAGEAAFIHCDKEVPGDGVVFKVGSAPEDHSALIRQLPAWEDMLRLHLKIHAGGLEASVTDRPDLPSWKISETFPAAEKRPVRVEAFVREFLKAGSERRGIRDVEAELDGEFFIAHREIRKLRQQFAEWLAANYRPPEPPQPEEHLQREEAAGITRTVALQRHADARETGRFDRIAVVEDPRPGDACILPAFCPETELPDLREQLREQIRGGVRVFRVTSLYHFELLSGIEGLTLHTAFPLPVTNHFAMDLLKAMGAEKVQLWVELEKEALLPLITAYPASAELFRYGRLPILQTRAELPAEGQITDARGAGFRIENGEVLTHLYPEAVFFLPVDDLPPVSDYTDLTRARPEESTVSRFNYDRELA